MTRRESGGEPSFWQFARDFLRSYCPKVRRMSPKTVEAYRIGMESYITYLVEVNSISRKEVAFENFSRQTVKGYSTWMQEIRGYAPKTIDLRLTVLKSFLRYSSSEDISLMAIYESVSLVKPPVQPKRPVDYMAKDATTAVLAAFDGLSSKSRRNRMLLILLYDSAARVSEIADAMIEDLHLTKPAFISLTGKGNKTRNMPLMDKTVEHFKVYLDEFHPDFRRSAPSTPLFYSNRDGVPHKLSTDSVSSVLKKAGDIARKKCVGIPTDLHCHLIRKTRAMDLYGEGIPLPLIMQMLGHESMSTTSTFYAFATMKMMTDAIKSANPNAVGEPANWKEASIMDTLYRL